MMVEPAVTKSASRSSTSTLPETPSTILIADDEHLVATGLASALRELGFDVCGPVADGDKAIALCQKEQPDLALLDIRMPRMDGLSAANVIYPQLGIPVIIVSAYSDQEYVQSGGRVGVFGYLLKPVTKEQLRAGIAIAWGRFRRTAEQDAEIMSLKKRLENRKVIEEAKWIIVSRTGISEPDAMRLLQRQARNNRRPLIDVARDVIENDGKA